MRGGKAKKSTRSVMGQLLPPVDIRDEKQLNELDKRIQVGPITLVLVYADWCGHCQHYKPIMEELEKLPNRSVQTARIREDLFPKSSINNAKIEGYPSLLLVEPSGKVETFKNESGEVTNALPEHTDINKMKSIVRTAGLPEGQKILNSAPNVSTRASATNASAIGTSATASTPPNILADRLESNTVNSVNSQLTNTKNKALQASILHTKPQQGGGLWASLYQVSNKLAPAASLFLASELTKKHSKTGKRRRSNRKTLRRRK